MFGFIGRRIKKTGKTFGRWAHVSLLKRTFYFMRDIFLFILKRNKEVVPDETFAQAVARMQLTEADLKKREGLFKIQIVIYVIGILMTSAYMTYLISTGYFLSAAITLLIIIFLASNVLKSHFWLFQLKQRKLGCTLREWFNSSIKESE